jgi:hypothetical protein
MEMALQNIFMNVGEDLSIPSVISIGIGPQNM